METFDEQGYGIAVDSSGNAYVVGRTISTTFPTLNAYDTSLSGTADAFVAKLNPAASGAASLLSRRLLVAAVQESGAGIAVDAAGYAYVTGFTNSSDFPTLNAFDTTLAGASDVYVTKLDAALTGTASLIYSTYLGASSDDQGTAIAVDTAGDAYVTGLTTSTDYPLLNAYQTTFAGNYDAFVTKLTAGAPTKSADLSVSIADAPDPVPEGSNITYTIVVSNGGPGLAEGVTVTAPLPAGLAFVRPAQAALKRAAR